MVSEQSGANADDREQALTRTIPSSGSAGGTLIDSYHLLERIGQGGMGEVWLAEQRQPVRRRVAIKLIKPGMDTHEVVARFQSERQALALMDHPAIAKVFDAGSTPEGRPYFAMEYVAGMPITDYCDKHKLGMRQRLELFMLVCEGVQHAHQKAIIHRDLKPSNILVGEIDGRPMPRIIDFGVAKATSQRLSAATLHTQVGALIGTLGYISPEQADSGSEDIDTRTDVYSLGVVLYELLVGSLPFDFHRLSYDEILRLLREQDAPRPSAKISTMGRDSTLTAQKRGADPPALARQLRGDADAIALKALEKERARRYATPSELADDIGRFLRNEPVVAQRSSTGYRARKYVRRHRLGVSVAIAGLLLMAALVVAQTFQLRRITRERDRADRIAEFMKGIFRVSNPSEARGSVVTARELLDRGAQEIGATLGNDPELQAEMKYTMGDTYLGLGLYARARALLEDAVAIQRRVLGPKSPETLRSMSLLARAMAFGGQSGEAEKLARETLDAQRRVVGPEHPDTVYSLGTLALAVKGEGRLAQAERLYQGTLDLSRKVLGPEHAETVGVMGNLANTLVFEGHYPEAEKLYREILEISRRVRGPDHPDTVHAMGGLAGVLANEGQYAEAEALTREVIAVERRVFGPEHPETLLMMSNLAQDLTREGRYADGVQLFAETLAIDRRVLGPAHPQTLQNLQWQAGALSREGQYGEAQALFQEAIQTARQANQREVLVNALYNFACAAARTGHRDEAFTYLAQAMDSGFSAAAAMAADSDLTALHGDPRFEALIAKARQTAAVNARTP
jgi:non-specific serine/threonine protein kinase/serine/threonine-protein kinase